MRTTRLLLLAIAATTACGEDTAFIEKDAQATDTSTVDAADEPIVDGGGCLFCDVSTTDALPPSPAFFILVTQTPAGSPSPSDWGGVLRYNVPDDFQPVTTSTAIPAADVGDPVGLAFRQTSAEVFVGNRRGNTTGSITRFLYDAGSQSFTSNGDLTMSDFGAVVQVAFSHDEMELFAARDAQSTGEISRFKFDLQGNMSANGIIATSAEMIGVAVSKDGTRLYATQQFSPTVREFQLPSGTEIQGFTIPNASRPHLMVMDQKTATLYVGDINSGFVYALAVDGNDDLSLKQSIAATNPISVALSPDRMELFATSHNGSPPDVIDRFRLVSNSWVSEGASTTINTTTALGGTLVFSVGAVPTPIN